MGSDVIAAGRKMSQGQCLLFSLLLHFPELLPLHTSLLNCKVIVKLLREHGRHPCGATSSSNGKSPGTGSTQWMLGGGEDEGERTLGWSWLLLLLLL